MRPDANGGASAPGRDGDASNWPVYRPRQAVTARRLAGPAWIDGHYYRDGYLVRDDAGHIGVMAVADFEAIYERAD